MREELKKVLNDHLDRLIQELDVSVTFLAKLVSRGVINADHKKIIQSKSTPQLKVDELMCILAKVEDGCFETFCSVVNDDNSDLSIILAQHAAHIEPRKTRFVYPHYDKIDLKNCHPPDIINGFKEVQRKDLEDYIDPENGLLDRLGSHGIIDIPEINILLEITPYQSLNGELLRKIEINIDSIGKPFIEALCEDEQDYVAKFIVSGGCKTDSDERLLPRELRDVIDDNMFCLKELINTEKQDLLMKLVTAKCIRKRHRERVMNFKPDEEKAYQLLIIIQRRRFKDFFNFMECLRKTLQRNVVKVLENGGVTEIKVQLLQTRSDKKNIATELIRKLTGYVDDDKASDLSEDQKKIVDELLAELAENDIYFIGTCTVNSNSDSMSMFFQGEKADPFPALESGCESGVLKDKLENLFLSLLEIPDKSWPPLVKIVTTGKHSHNHHTTTQTEQNLEGISNFEATQDKVNDDGDEMNETDQETREQIERGSYNRREQQRISTKYNLERANLAQSSSKSVETNESNTVENVISMEKFGTKMADLQNEIRNMKQRYCNQETTKCYQLKICPTRDDDLAEVIRNFEEREMLQPVLDIINPIKDRWRTLDLLKIVQCVNPCPIIVFGREEHFKQDSFLPENKDDMTFRCSIVLCYIFEDLMQSLGWKVGDTTLDIEEDICYVLGKLIVETKEQDRSSMLNWMQSAMINICVNGSGRGSDKLLRSLLIKKKKYNGLNLACILLEQIILDNIESKESWMRIVCRQFIDLIVQLIIEPDYRDDIHWTLNYLMKLEPHWAISDIYNLLKNGLLLFQYRQDYFHQYLMMIPTFALPPPMHDLSWENVHLKHISSLDENNLRCLISEAYEEEKEKSLDQVLFEMKEGEIGQADKDSIREVIKQSHTKLIMFENDYESGILQELERIKNLKQNDDVEVMSSCLAVTSMAIYLYKEFWPLNTQLISYCLLVTQIMNGFTKGRLLEILTGEGKSCVIAMIAATYALQGRTVDIVTNSPVLSQRDAKEWQEFYTKLKITAACNVEEIREGDAGCYECPIVYGTVETFARDILKTEFLLQDVRKGRKCDIVIVDEVDSMLIDHGIQCTYLGNDVVSGMRHFEPILAMIWMHVGRFIPFISDEGILFFELEKEDLFMTLYRLNNEIDPLHIVRLAEEDTESGIEKGFTDEYLRKDIEGQKKLLINDNLKILKSILLFAQKVLHLDFDIYYDPNYMNYFISDCIRQNVNVRARIVILVDGDGLCSVVLHEEIIKENLTKMITRAVLSDENETKIDLPRYLRDYCYSRLKYWIDNAILAQKMQSGREYIVQDSTIYPVDYKSSGVIEINKKWGDGLQQFLEMKHGCPRSPLSLITNFLSNIDFFERYGSNIVGVSGTLGNDAEKEFMSDAFSVDLATIPTSKRRKLFEIEGLLLKNKGSCWEDAIRTQIQSTIARQRAVLVICEDIAHADQIHKFLSRGKCESKMTLYLHTNGEDYDGGRLKRVLKPGDVVITTNLGARGTDLVIDDIVNKNGGLFVLVTFIPLNDRVEKQAFGRTGRRGATGSCQIIVSRKTMPEWSRLCVTVDEVKHLRDSMEMLRLKKTKEVNLMRNKQQLFQKYCELKKKFLTSSNSDSDDLKIQEEILDETWAKWIQNYETMDHASNDFDMVQELCQMLGDCFERAKRFESDNIYHILQFGEVRLKKGDFKEASKFYDQVICVDPEWSAFAHYNRSYCTIQLKDDGYRKHAIDDLKAALFKLETYKARVLFSETYVNTSIGGKYRMNDSERNNRFTQYYIMMECQLLHHIDTQINEAIEKLEALFTMNGEVMAEQQDILDLIPGADCMTEKMLKEYRQLGLLFTYNIEEKPKICYNIQLISSLVMLEIRAYTFLLAFWDGILRNGHSIELKDMINDVRYFEANDDGPLGWMSRCFRRSIVIGIHSIHFIRDISSLVTIKQTELESISMRISETSEFTQYANSQARSILKLLARKMQEMNNLVSFQKDEILLCTTNVVSSELRMKIQPTLQEKLAQGQKLYRELYCLYGSVSSQYDLHQYVDCIRNLAKLSAYSLHFDAVIQDIADNFWSNSRNGSITLTDSNTSKMATTTEAQIGIVITKFSDFLSDKINLFNQKTENSDGHFCDDGQMIEETIKVLTSTFSDLIQEMIQNRITRLLMLDVQKTILKVSETIKDTLSLTDCEIISLMSVKQNKPSPLSADITSLLKEYNNDMKQTGGLNMRSLTLARMLSNHWVRNIIILDVDKEAIVEISSPKIRRTIELVYNPPCHAYPGGHFNAYIDENVVNVSHKKKICGNDDDYDLLCTAVDVVLGTYSSSWAVGKYMKENPSVAGKLIASDVSASQLKCGRALLRLDMKHLKRGSENVELDSSHLSSCIERASKSTNRSRLARVLAEYESESKDAETEMVTSQVSRDACKLFLSSGSSVDTEIYRQLIVERINDGDITTALKLCYFGHQVPFCRVKMYSNLPISDAQTLKNAFKQMLKIDSYEQERSKFLSICDEWYRVLEPLGLMNIDHRELLKEWITDRQYANTEDPVVSQAIMKCSNPRI